MIYDNYPEKLICKYCKEEKNFKKDFYHDKYRADGLLRGAVCKICIKNYKNGIIKKEPDNIISKYDLIKLYQDTEYDKNVCKTTCYSSLFVASSKGGKSTLIKKLLQNLEDRFDIIIIFSESLHDPMYDFINYGEKSKYIAFDQFNNKIIQDLFELQKKTKNSLNCLVLFDDLVNVTTRDNNLILQMYIRGRNSGINIWFSTQHYSMIGRAMRANSNYVFIGRTNSPAVKISLAEQFLYGVLKVPDSYNTKNKKVDYITNYITDKTQNFGFIMVNNLGDPPTTYLVNAMNL